MWKKIYSIIESYSLNENTQTLDLIEILSSCALDIPIPNASIDPNEVVIINSNIGLRSQLIDKLLIIKQLKTDSKSNPFPTDISTTTNTITKPAQTNDNINSNNNNNNNNNKNNNNNNDNNNCKSKNNENNNKNKTNNNSTNEKAVYNEKLQVQLEEIWKEKHTNFLNLKTHEEQEDQTDLSQRNKSRECISSA